MAEVWQTIEQAAVTLGLSVRTVNRHITGGKLQSRLFEGRREVLVSLPEPVKPEPTAMPSASTAKPAAIPGQPVGTSADPTVNFTFGQSGSIGPSVNQDPMSQPSQQYDSVRRAMAGDYSSEKPLDMQTMLTLADSVDDKASLAVAAYQTLARSAETQVQSLRKVALGAWASVGLLAAGAIVAVGWGTYRLTWAEGTAASLRTQVNEQKEKIRDLEQERESRRTEFEKARLETAKLQLQLEHLPAAQAAADTVAELARHALQHIKEQDAAPATRPASDKLLTAGPSTAPTTRPVNTAVAANAPTRSPVTQPASMPATTGQRPQYNLSNSLEPFDPR